MTRSEIRAIKNKLKCDSVEFFKIENCYFTELIQDIKKLVDSRNHSYTTYEIEVILYVIILKNVCSIESIQGMVEQFNEDECVGNIYRILGLEEKDYLLHYVTINECLAKLNTKELEKMRKDMVYKLIQKKSFDSSGFLGTHWLVMIDATQLFCFKERHCDHCMTTTLNRGSEEKTIYYHQVLEARIVIEADFVISIATEFIENTEENVRKQDCEIKSFKRLAKSLKEMFPRLPICLMGDGLYACESVFDICQQNNWEFLIRCKNEIIPNLAEKYEEVNRMGECEEEIVEVETVYKRNPKVRVVHKLKWVNNICYCGHELSVMCLEIESEKKKKKEFQCISSISITNRSAHIFAETERKRWLIENKEFNIQKNYRYISTYENCLNYNGMKNHYLLTQLADVLVQSYEKGFKDIKIVKSTIGKIAKSVMNVDKYNNCN